MQSRSAQALTLFFALAYAIPWAGWSAIAFGLVAPESPWRWPLFFTGVVCSIAGLVAAGWDEGWPGVRRLLAQAMHWRVSPLWWAFALIAPLAWALAPALIYFAVHRAPIDVHPEALLAYAAPATLLATLFAGPIGEEFGWRGFLLPRMAQRFSPLPAALLLGLLWAFGTGRSITTASSRRPNGGCNSW